MTPPTTNPTQVQHEGEENQTQRRQEKETGEKQKRQSVCMRFILTVGAGCH
jgi:hypothetical protein